MTVKLELEAWAGSSAAPRRALFLHGILGRGGNLRTVARRFVKARPDWDAWLVDLRGHGASPKGMPGASLAAAAADVRALCANATIGAIIGHSFGGKVALELLRQGFVTGLQVVTLDSNPGTREPLREGDSALAVVDMLRELPPRFTSRSAFIDAVIAHGKSRGLAQWLALSLVPAPEGGVGFGLDLNEIEELLASYFAADLWSVVESPPRGAGVHLVIGEKSTSYSAVDRERAGAIAARNAQVSVDFLATDHWVHAEDPEGVLRILLSYLK